MIHCCCVEFFCGGKSLWEQSLLAKQATRFMEDRVACIAGKPCSHKSCSHKLQQPRSIQQ
ncbi:hypothetical protein B0E42_21730 [Pseudomonas sp. A25(2017)]|nr:hypothetical protein B0E42_21730 [Pseudomonas sp. A25(2017)]